MLDSSRGWNLGDPHPRDLKTQKRSGGPQWTSQAESAMCPCSGKMQSCKFSSVSKNIVTRSTAEAIISLHWVLVRLFQGYRVQPGDPVQGSYWKLEYGGPEVDGVDTIKGECKATMMALTMEERAELESYCCLHLPLGGYRVDGVRVLSELPSESTGGSRCEEQQGEFLLHLKGKLFTMAGGTHAGKCSAESLI